jgi:N-acetyl-anhydromuramyl-L-alanine amidase AmpD
MLVIHTMEAAKTPSTARGCAAYFAKGTRRASAHYCVDSGQVYQSVRERDVAWHAPNANDRAIGIEHAGYARQTPAEWSDSYNDAMLRLSAKVAADICRRNGIPIVKLSPEDVAAKKPGIAGHVDVSKGTGVSGGHWDPGPNFPWDRYIALVREAANQTSAAVSGSLASSDCDAKSVACSFLPARWFTPGRTKRANLVVIHSMEGGKTPYAAKTCANFFAKGSRRVSAHYCVDSGQVYQSVREQDTAWHAPNANARAIGIEHAGYARQTPAEWADSYNSAMLKRSAKLVADICRRNRIPIVKLSASDVAAGKAGIASHADVTKGTGVSGGHWDPGPNFPWDRYIAMVREAAGQTSAAVSGVSSYGSSLLDHLME